MDGRLISFDDDDKPIESQPERILTEDSLVSNNNNVSPILQKTNRVMFTCDLILYDVPKGGVLTKVKVFLHFCSDELKVMTMKKFHEKVVEKANNSKIFQNRSFILFFDETALYKNDDILFALSRVLHETEIDDESGILKILSNSKTLKVIVARAKSN